MSSITHSLTSAQRAHTRRVLWLMLAYVIILPTAIWLRSHVHLSNLAAAALALAASLPVLGIFASWGRYLSDEKDEYHHMVVMRRNAIATNATMGTCAVWGFLQAFGVMPLVEAYWIPVVWVVAQGCAPLFFRKGE